MRALRFVGPGEDSDHVILRATDGEEQFTLLIDSALRDACRADLPRLSPASPEPVSRISPRDIQMRVRAGEPPQALADENDVPLEKVMRFAEAVLAERTRIADEARRSRARLNGEGQFVEFGETVDARFGTYGIDSSLVRWDSRRRQDGQWIITATWIGGLDAADDHSAEWALNLANRTVSPLDSTASDLLSDRPVVPVTAEDSAGFDDTADALVEADEARRPVVSVVARTAPGVRAFPARPDALTGPLPGSPEPVFDQTLFEDDVPADAEEPAAKVTNLGVARKPDNPYVESGDEKADRARIPSWDDILLGVRRKGD
ncbi:MAG TPA: septation protein SepH [Jatrophihabitans sp.]|jgi:hypothetical protein